MHAAEMRRHLVRPRRPHLQDVVHVQLHGMHGIRHQPRRHPLGIVLDVHLTNYANAEFLNLTSVKKTCANGFLLTESCNADEYKHR